MRLATPTRSVLRLCEAAGRQAGVLLGATATDDVVDATVVLLAQAGDHIVTSDRTDIANLLGRTRQSVLIVDC